MKILLVGLFPSRRSPPPPLSPLSLPQVPVLTVTSVLSRHAPQGLIVARHLLTEINFSFRCLSFGFLSAKKPQDVVVCYSWKWSSPEAGCHSLPLSITPVLPGDGFSFACSPCWHLTVPSANNVSDTRIWDTAIPVADNPCCCDPQPVLWLHYRAKLMSGLGYPALKPWQGKLRAQFRLYSRSGRFANPSVHSLHSPLLLPQPSWICVDIYTYKQHSCVWAKTKSIKRYFLSVLFFKIFTWNSET